MGLGGLILKGVGGVIGGIPGLLAGHCVDKLLGSVIGGGGGGMNIVVTHDVKIDANMPQIIHQSKEATRDVISCASFALAALMTLQLVFVLYLIAIAIDPRTRYSFTAAVGGIHDVLFVVWELMKLLLPVAAVAGAVYYLQTRHSLFAWNSQRARAPPPPRRISGSMIRSVVVGVAAFILVLVAAASAGHAVLGAHRPASSSRYASVTKQQTSSAVVMQFLFSAGPILAAVFVALWLRLFQTTRHVLGRALELLAAAEDRVMSSPALLYCLLGSAVSALLIRVVTEARASSAFLRSVSGDAASSRVDHVMHVAVVLLAMYCGCQAVLARQRAA